jgi:hypothetical protein
MTCSQIKGEVWQIPFEKKGNFRKNFGAVSQFGEFLPKKEKNPWIKKLSNIFF